MGERIAAERFGLVLPLALAAVYAGIALLAPLDPAWLLALGPLVFAFAVTRLRHLPVLLMASAPLGALALRAAFESDAQLSCSCTPTLNAGLLAGAIIAGSWLPVDVAIAISLSPLAASVADLSGPGLRAGVLRSMRPEAGFVLIGAAVLLVFASEARRHGVRSYVAGGLACAIFATGLSWTRSFEVPVMSALLDRPQLAGGRAAVWAYAQLMARGDEPAVRALLARVHDDRRPALMAAAARLGAPADPLLESELAAPSFAVRRAALRELVPRGPLGARPAFLEALATHRVTWPAGAFSAQPEIATAVAALEAPRREAWYPAAMRLLRGRAPGIIPDEPPLALALARLAGLVPPSRGMEEYRLLWHPAEGMRLAAAAAVALHPDGPGRAGEAPRVLQILTEAREADRAAPGDPARTPSGPTAPLRLLLFGALVARQRVSPEALKAAESDPLPLIKTLAARGPGPAAAPGGIALLDLTDLHP